MSDNKFYNMMLDEINKIQTEDIRNFAVSVLDILPEYFFSVPSSSSGKYHPEDEIAEGGLVLHTLKVKKVLDELFITEVEEFTDREKDLLRVAALFHDGWKSGDQDEYEENQHTSFYHPILGSIKIQLKSVLEGFDYDDANYIADAISTHMGKWNTSKRDTGELPTPKTKAEKFLHLADYIASRKNILFKF